METEDYFRDLVIDTPEAAANLLKAIEDADRRGPIDTTGAHKPDADPEFIRKVMESLKQ